MIFAAGMGTRFKPWTDTHPKALALVNGKSLLQRNIEYLQHYDIHEVVVNVHHFADQIKAAVHENNGWGSKVHISDETAEVLETGGGLMKAAPLLLGNEPFITLNADFLTNLDLHALQRFHAWEQAFISFGVTSRNSTRNFLFDDNNRLCGWRNDSTGEAVSYTHLDVYKRQLFNNLSPREFEITALLLKGDGISHIAHSLNLQVSTVGTHKSRIFEKLKVTNLIELKELATSYGIE